MREGQLPLSAALLRPSRKGVAEDDAYRRGFTTVAGVDEVGRGPLAGPVVAAAVILPRGFTHPEITDSKMLTEKQRQRLVSVIKDSAVGWSLGIVSVAEIDRINIFNASFAAMIESLQQLHPVPDHILIDGKQMIPRDMFPAAKVFGAQLPQQRSVVKGDQLCLCIAAASIVAKVARDEIMVRLDAQYPQYGFAENKGYASASHLDALRRYGPSPVHRYSFQPVREADNRSAVGESDSLFRK